MILAILHAQSKNLDFAKSLAAFNLKPDRIWRAGESDSRGRAHNESGFTLQISNSSSKTDLIGDLREFLKNQVGLLRDLKSHDVELSLDIGVTVGTNEQFTASVELDTHDLAALVQAGIAVQFSAYPAS